MMLAALYPLVWHSVQAFAQSDRATASREVVVPGVPTLRLADGRELQAVIAGQSDTEIRLRQPDGAEERIRPEALRELRFDTITGEPVVGVLKHWANGVYDLQVGAELVRVYTAFGLPAPPTQAAVAAAPAEPAKPATAPAAAGGSGVLITVASAPTVENRSELTFEVRLAEPASTPIALIYATIDGTAKTDADFQARRGVLPIAAGQQQAVISVPLVDDRLVEGDERFELFLSVDPKRASLAQRQVAGTIKDDDGAITQ